MDKEINGSMGRTTGKAGTPVDSLVSDAQSMLDWAKRSSPVVANTLKSGGGLEAVIFNLVQENSRLFEAIIKLEAIAPRKFLIEGKTYIYRCPDEMVPAR